MVLLVGGSGDGVVVMSLIMWLPTDPVEVDIGVIVSVTEPEELGYKTRRTRTFNTLKDMDERLTKCLRSSEDQRSVRVKCRC